MPCPLSHLIHPLPRPPVPSNRFYSLVQASLDGILLALAHVLGLQAGVTVPGYYTQLITITYFLSL